VAVLIGVVLAVAVGLFATALRLDRDRAFYPTVMMVIAVLYILFGLMGATTGAWLRELPFSATFFALAAVGFKKSLWLVATALAAHGIFDLLHHSLVNNAGVPAFWPAFCSSYDIAAAIYLSWLLKSNRLRATV
jgi:heme A synthase